MARHVVSRIAAWVVPFSILFALLAWGVSSPVGSSPDDDYHLASIWCANGEREGLCEEASSPKMREVPSEIVQASGCFRFHADRAANCPLPVGDLEPTKRGNWYDQAYPPLFYSVMNVFVGSDASVSVLLMRGFNALLFVGLLVLLCVLLPSRLRPIPIWSAALTMVPLGMFLVPSVNPSSWAVIAATGLVAATAGYLTVEPGWRLYALGAMVVGLLLLGAGARGDSAVYGVAAIGLGALLVFRGAREYGLRSILLFVLAVVSAWMFFSAGQSAVISSETTADAPLPLGTLAFVDAKLLPELWAGVFGTWGLGWLDTPMPGIVWVTTTAVFAAIVFAGLRYGRPLKFAALALAALALVVVPMYILLHDGVIIGSYVQPRYIYPLIILFASVAVFGMPGSRLGLTRLQAIVVAVGLTLANSAALHVNIRRYVTGTDVPNFNLSANAEWWWGGPITPMMVWLGGSVAFGLGAAALVWLAEGRRLSHSAGEAPESDSDGSAIRPGSQASVAG